MPLELCRWDYWVIDVSWILRFIWIIRVMRGFYLLELLDLLGCYPRRATADLALRISRALRL